MRAVILLGLILVVSTVAPIAPAAADPPDPPVTCPVDHPSHPPIVITEDAGPQGFILAREPVTQQPIYRPGSGVIAGNGTAEDPYVIEGWCLTPTDDTIRAGVPQAALTIEDTSAHVTVRDTIIDGQIVPRVIQGQPGWTDIEHSVPGMRIDGAENVAIVDSRIENLQASAIDVSDGHNVRIEGTLAEGIWVVETTGLAIVGNEVPDTPADDSELVPGINDGVVLLDSPGAVVADNLVRRTSDDGIVLKESHGSLVTDNTVKNALRMGIVIKSSDGVHVRGNTLHSQNFHGIKVARSSDVIVGENTLTENSDGMLLFRLRDSTIANNTVDGQRGPAGVGLDIQHSSGVRIVDNTITDNPQEGILLWEGFTGQIVDTTIARNVITGNEIGIRFGPGDDHRDNVVTQNNIHGNAQDGLEVDAGETVDATGNWWGCVDGPDDPACDRVTGDAVYDPWLTGPNPEAGAD